MDWAVQVVAARYVNQTATSVPLGTLQVTLRSAFAGDGAFRLAPLGKVDEWLAVISGCVDAAALFLSPSFTETCRVRN